MAKKILSVAIALLLAPIVASAACVSSGTMRGTWQVFTGGPPTFSTECTLSLGANGEVASGSCRVRDAGGTSSVSATGGSLAVSSACTVTGTVQTTGFTLTIQSARLDLTRNLLVGVGRDNFGNFGPFNAVRY